MAQRFVGVGEKGEKLGASWVFLHKGLVDHEVGAQRYVDHQTTSMIDEKST